MPQEASPGVQEMFTVALRHHQAGRLAEAEALYQRVLQADSRHVDALHFLGVIAHQNGRNDAAVELIGKPLRRTTACRRFTIISAMRSRHWAGWRRRCFPTGGR